MTFFPFLMFTDCIFSLDLHLDRVSVTDVAHAVQLLQDDTPICFIARFAVSPSAVSRAWRRFWETGSYSRRATK